MALKNTSLGTSANTTQAINITTSTNATPIVVTFTAGHGLVDGKRIAIAGVTGNTAANGEWSLQFTAANTARLLGSVGNGTHGGTVRVAIINDATPFMANHSAVLALTGNHVGVVDIEAYDSYADFAVSTGANTSGSVAPIALGAGVTNSAGSASTPAKSTITTAATNPSFTTEIRLPRYLRAVPTTATSGTFSATIMA
jgi:hypothetical protein